MPCSPTEDTGQHHEEEGEKTLQVTGCLDGKDGQELDKDSKSNSADSRGIVEYKRVEETEHEWMRCENFSICRETWMRCVGIE